MTHIVVPACSSQVRVYDLSRYEHAADDVLILATDGLWDVLSNEEVADAITQFLPNCDPDDPHRSVPLFPLDNLLGTHDLQQRL